MEGSRRFSNFIIDPANFQNPPLCSLLLTDITNMAGKDYYKILGIQKDATDEQIKKA